MSKELKAWFTVDELNAWAEKKLKENPQWAEQPAQQDIPDLIAGTMGVSRGTAYDLMREALAKAHPQQERPSFVEWTTDYVQDNLHKLKPAPVQQEPVAKKTRIGLVTSSGWDSLPVGTEFYTSPPAQLKPLTDEEIESINVRLAGSRDLARLFARAIEAAHGIKENT